MFGWFWVVLGWFERDSSGRSVSLLPRWTSIGNIIVGELFSGLPFRNYRMVAWHSRMVTLILRINYAIQNWNLGKQLKFGNIIPAELIFGPFS